MQARAPVPDPLLNDPAIKFRWIGLIIVLGAFVLSAIYAFTNPPFESPDEPAHLATINFVSKNLRLPNPLTAGENTSEAHQHPLYYIAGAFIIRLAVPDASVDLQLKNNPDFKPHGGTRSDVPKYLHQADAFPNSNDRIAFYGLRLLNCLFVAFTAGLALSGGRVLLVWPWSLLPGIIVATLPQFQFIGSAISNDALATMLAMASAVAAIAATRKPDSAWAWFVAGIWVGLAVLAKKSNLIFVPWCFLLAFSACVPISMGSAIKGVLSFALPALALTGLIVWRNVTLFGDPLGTAMEHKALAPLLVERGITDPYFWTTFPMITGRSFIGHFGWMNVYMPRIAIAIVSSVILMGMLGSIGSFWTLELRPRVVFLWLLLLIGIASLAWYNLSFEQPQGRLLFHVLGAIVLLAGLGWQWLTTKMIGKIYAVALLAVALLVADAAFWITNQRFYGS